MVKVERQTEDKAQMMRRTPRILHESSFATSVFTSGRGQRRPPGFVASSLDYKSRTAGTTVAHNDVTTKPGRNKKYNDKQQEEYLEREKQYKQRRHYRSGHPTRAQGNFGPPAPAVDSLKDLENMSEEQLYKLFTEDPNFHQTLLEATEKGQQKINASPSSAPVGANKGRRSTGRKPYSKADRNAVKTKKINFKDVEREVPYLQWLFLFILIGTAIYKSFKSSANPISTKAFGGISKNDVVRKQKSKKKRKPVIKASTRKNIAEDNAKLKTPTAEAGTFEKKSSCRKKKKKKKNASVVGSTTISSDIEGKENITECVEENLHEPNLDKNDGSSGKNGSETAKLDNITQIVSDSSPISSNYGETWQIVTKSSKGIRKEKVTMDPKPSKETNDFVQPAAQNVVDDGDSIDRKNKTSGTCSENDVRETDAVARNVKTEENKGITFDDKGKFDIAQTITVTRNDTEGHSMTSNVENSNSSSNDGKQRALTTTENDAALALQLHEEEMNLAKAAIEIREDELWEEVTVKKRKA